MALEIERKFRLSEPPAWLRDHPASEIEQGYLVIGEQTEVRLRRIGSRRALTVKSGHGEVRKEAEAEIDARQFWAFWPLTASRRLRKTRYLVPLNDLTVEVDVFSGDLEGLVLAEVEFESEEKSDAFQAPDWLGEEVTGERRYANQSLVESGVPDAASDMNDRSGKEEIVSTSSESGPSRAYRIKGSERVKQGVRRIARGRAQNILDELEPSSDAVHQARKDLKKLRSLLRLVRSSLGKKFYRAENRRFREIGARLAAARDAKVKLETLGALQEHADELDRGGLKRYSGALEGERRATGEALEKDGVSEAVEEVTLGRNRVSGWRLDAPEWELVGPGLVRSYRRGRKRMRSVIEDPSDEAVHEWRKRVKDLWYQLRIVREAWPALISETADQAHGLADLLGDHHDLAVLRDDVRERPELFDDHRAADALLDAAVARQAQLLEEAIDLGKRIYAEKPKHFSRRYEAYWLAWRP